MATSSIFANITLTEPDQIEAFINALEASIADPMPPPKGPRQTALSDPDQIKTILGKWKDDR